MKYAFIALLFAVCLVSAQGVISTIELGDTTGVGKGYVVQPSRLIETSNTTLVVFNVYRNASFVANTTLAKNQTAMIQLSGEPFPCKNVLKLTLYRVDKYVNSTQITFYHEMTTKCTVIRIPKLNLAN